MPRATSKPGLAGQFDIGFDPSRDHHQIGFQFFARSEAQAVHPAVSEQRLGLFRQHHPYAQALDFALQVCAAGGVKLALHQRLHQMHDAHFAAAQLQAARGFQAQQSAADHHGLAPFVRLFKQRARVIQACGRRARSFSQRPESEE